MFADEQPGVAPDPESILLRVFVHFHGQGWSGFSRATTSRAMPPKSAKRRKSPWRASTSLPGTSKRLDAELGSGRADQG